MSLQEKKREPLLNKMVSWLLRSRLHGVVSKKIMLLEMTGRKSGRKYTFPISYVRDGEVLLCLADRATRTWWKNLRGGADVTLWLRGQQVTGVAQAIDDDLEAIAERFEKMLIAFPSGAKHYDVGLDEGKRPFPADITRAAQQIVIVEIKI